MTNNTRKNVPWSGWAKEKPGTHERTIMLKKCGSKCFLGSKKSFPICRKNTCRVDRRGSNCSSNNLYNLLFFNNIL